MDDPALSDIAAATSGIVAKYRKQNQLTSLTPRLVRQEVEQTLKLTAGTLDAKTYKDAVRKATSAAMADKDDSDSHSKAAVKSKKRKSDGNHTEVATKKVKNPQSKTAKQPSPGGSAGDKKGKMRKESKVFKSVEIIETSDEEEDASPATPRSKANKISAKRGPPKNQRKAMASSSDHEPGPYPASHSQAKSGRVDADIQSNAAAKAGSSTLKRPIELKNENGDKSESEMSVLIDATPMKKKSKKGQKGQEDAKKERKVKKSNKTGLESSKHEDTVKRLKSLVHACGVRKVWSKEFQDIDKPLQQIKRLKEILKELGMDGRPSMEKAKAIKEKRDLAKELEDVRAFERSAGQSSRPSRNTGKQTAESGSEDHNASESEHSGDSLPNQRNAARRSIMAFLGDDSDGE
jgi:hypothetical protein